MRPSKTKRERGFVLITMTFAAIGLIGALGMAVDLGRAFIAKNETQAFCDAASLNATLYLDGTSNGITAAQTAVANTTNAWNLDSAKVANPQVDFATSGSGPWVSNPSPATGYIFTRVQASVALPLYFLPVVVNQFTMNVNTAAIAGQTPVTKFSRGLAPYTVVSTNTDPSQSYALQVGTQYSIQWPASNANSFIRPPCAGDVAGSATGSYNAVLANWPSSVNGYWGSTSAVSVYQEVLDAIQASPISLNENIFSIMTSGDKKTEAKALDLRVQEDGDFTDNDLTAYLANPNHNGRRFIALPIVDPSNPSTTTVLNFASFFLLSDGTANSSYYFLNSGNQPFCAVFAGAYCQDCPNGGGSGTVGAFRVTLVQ